MNKFQEILKHANEQREAVSQSYHAHRERRHQETLDIVAEFAGKSKREKSVIQSRLDDERWITTLSKYKKYPTNYVDDSVCVHKVIKELEALRSEYSISQLAEALGLNRAKYLKKQLGYKLINANFAHRLKIFLGKKILRDDYNEEIHGAKHNHQVDYSKYKEPKKLDIEAKYTIDKTVDHDKITELLKKSHETLKWTQLAAQLNVTVHTLKSSVRRNSYTTALTWKLKKYYGNQILLSENESKK